MAVEESFLRCTACEQDAAHEVVYAGRFVTQIVCVNCGAVTRLDVRQDYLPDLADRITSKPRRLAGLLRSDPGAMTTMPRRTVSKPWRMLAEIRTVFGGRGRRDD